MHNIYILHIYRILAEVELSQCHFEQWCSGSSSPIRGDVGEKVGQSWCRAGLQHTCQSNCKSCYFFLTVLLKPSQDRLATVGTPAATTLLVLYQAYIDLNIDIYIY